MGLLKCTKSHAPSKLDFSATQEYYEWQEHYSLAREHKDHVSTSQRILGVKTSRKCTSMPVVSFNPKLVVR